MINKTGHFVEQKALTYTEKLHIQKPIAVIGYGYRVFKSKQINFKLGKETITLQPDLISVSIPL